MQVPEPQTAECLEPTGHRAQTNFPLRFLHPHGKTFQEQTWFPIEPVSTNVTHVQDDLSESPTMDQEMNKPFMLASSVPCNKELSAAFPCTTIETSIFPTDRDDEAICTFIVNWITDMTCDAMKPHFTVTSSIQDSVRRLIESNCKRDATEKELFCFLTIAMSPLCLPPLVNNAFTLIPLPVVSFVCVDPMNSSVMSLTLHVLHSRITPTMNSSTRHSLSSCRHLWSLPSLQAIWRC